MGVAGASSERFAAHKLCRNMYMRRTARMKASRGFGINIEIPYPNGYGMVWYGISASDNTSTCTPVQVRFYCIVNLVALSNICSHAEHVSQSSLSTNLQCGGKRVN